MPDTKTHTPAQTNNRLGIILMILTMLVFASQDGISRYLADQYNVYMIVMVRYWFFAGFVLVFARIRYGSIKTVARSRVPFIQTFRSLLLMIEVCVMVVGFVYLGLIQSYAVFAIYPAVNIRPLRADIGRIYRLEAMGRHPIWLYRRGHHPTTWLDCIQPVCAHPLYIRPDVRVIQSADPLCRKI